MSIYKPGALREDYSAATGVGLPRARPSGHLLGWEGSCERLRAVLGSVSAQEGFHVTSCRVPWLITGRDLGEQRGCTSRLKVSSIRTRDWLTRRNNELVTLSPDPHELQLVLLVSCCRSSEHLRLRRLH